ncbi:MAG: hypothetical protein H0X52_09000, partial [Gemmatimonadetes bacterium]|nr:hypothetical protein [Gemmatimonadota bacterium]
MPDQLAGLAHRVAQVVQESSDPDAIHASALIDLLYEPGVGKPLQRSISSLQMAAWLGNRPAAVLADLAAAYLIRAERAHTPRDLIAAIEVADEALEREPRNQTALYNRALALQRFGLVEEAAHGWQEYLRVDSVSGWAGEARRHRREALTIDPLPTPPGPDAPEVGYAAYAVADPQRARELGWCRVLGDWANAALTGDTERAEGHLQRAEALGRGLEQRAGGDATLAYGVRAIRGQAEGRGLRKLAQAHREFAAGCELQDRVEFRRAAPRFANAMAATDASPTLQAWARLLYGSMVFHSGDARLGETIFREVSAETDPARHPALAARARLLLAMVLLRGDRYEAVLEQAQKSHALFARAGERENEAVALDALAGTQFSLRDMDAGYALAQRALQRLQPFRDSYRLHNLLSYVAEFVAGDGFPRSAVRMQDEGVRVAERTGNPAYVVEARLTRARLLAAAGAFDRASADIATAEESLEKLGDPKVRGWMIAQRQMAAAATSLRAHPALVATALDSAATYYIEMSVPLLAFPAMVDGAWARVAAGDVSRGMTGLE